MSVVFACVILHNWILEHDGADAHGRSPAHWIDASDPTFDDARAAHELFKEKSTNSEKSQIDKDAAATRTSPATHLLGCQPPNHHVPQLNDLNDLTLDVDPDYVARQEMLIKHYQIAFERKQIKWMKARADVNL